MQVDIYLEEKYGSRNFQMQIPWLPEKIKYESGGTVRATYDILDKGPVEVPTGSGLRKYSWVSTFPGKQRTDKSMLRGTSQLDPSWYIARFEEWKTNKTVLTLTVTGYPINIDVIVDKFDGEATGAFGDFDYTVALIERRNLAIQTTKTEATPQRPTAAANTTTHTVMSGDNLWKIAQNKLGKGSRSTEIYNLNKEIIEATAKKHGYKSSNNGWWIFPGTVLTLPQ